MLYILNRIIAGWRGGSVIKRAYCSLRRYDFCSISSNFQLPIIPASGDLTIFWPPWTTAFSCTYLHRDTCIHIIKSNKSHIIYFNVVFLSFEWFQDSHMLSVHCSPISGQLGCLHHLAVTSL